LPAERKRNFRRHEFVLHPAELNTKGRNMVPVPVRDWGEAITSSIAQALSLFLAAVPRIVGFLIILAIGWMIATLVAKGAAALLRSIRFNDMAQRSGFAGFVANTGVETDSSGFVADIAKWFVRLITLVVAFDALGLPAVSDVLRQLLLWLPNLAVAIVVLILGGLAANWLAGLVRGATAKGDLGNPDLLASIARIAVWAFAIVIAVNQIGIARELVNTLFMATVGAVALALGLAFGIGGRETAAEILRGWYERSRRLATKAGEAEHVRHDVHSERPH
jgi:hypothetical protein